MLLCLASLFIRSLFLFQCLILEVIFKEMQPDFRGKPCFRRKSVCTLLTHACERKPVHIRQVTPLHIAQCRCLFFFSSLLHKNKTWFLRNVNRRVMWTSQTPLLYLVSKATEFPPTNGNFTPYLSCYLSDKSMLKSNPSLTHIMQLTAFEC